ncbi:hypothetical protein RclHR1_00220027 [Rhizophagus clarus]|uniref:Uncharacterized protein n=2 Tax=Rhizophagus clarus TaxID=94130 RepID=A0A2Z6QT97_9GLOM|nr:hypothetical protein RclHR1_00220027 [Rhizophagus clarus]
MMAENQNTYNSSSDGNDTRNPRPNLPRTRSVVGPRPLPSGPNYPKDSRDGSYQHQRQHSTSSIPEYYSVPPQNSNPQNIVTPGQPTIDTPDQPFPPLVSPKPQKPMPTVTNDIANALETQYPESLNGYDVQPSDTPKSWYKGDDVKLNLASDQDHNFPLQSNAESQSNIMKEIQTQPFHDNLINSNNHKFHNTNNQYQYSNSPQQQQQQQMYYQNFSSQQQQNYNNFKQQYQNEQYQATPSNVNLQNTHPIHQQSPQSSPPSSIHSTPRQSFSQSVNSFQQNKYQARNSQEIVQGQYMQKQQTSYQMAQNYGISSPVSISSTGYGPGRLYDKNNQAGTESSHQMSSTSQISTSPKPYPSDPSQMSYNDNSSPRSSMQSAQDQFSLAEYHSQRSSPPIGFPRQPSPGITIGPDGTPIPSSLSGANRGNWGQRTPTPERRPQPNTNIRLLIDDNIARRMTMTSVTLANDEKALQKYRDAAKKTNDPNVQVDYAKFLINMIECHDTSSANKNNEQINHQEKYNKLVEEASYWINLLAKKDNAEAMYIKGTWYEYGKFGQETKHDKAFRLYLSASKHDNPKAIYKVAEHYENNKDTKRALQFYKKAASQGDVSALYRLSLVYLLGELKTEPDYSQALIYLKSAAAKANEECPDGAYVYGMILAKEWDKVLIPDQVVAPDDHEAKEYIQKAANLGHVKALYKMGHCYEYANLGCQFDPILSVSYYKRAAEKGDAEADMALSKWYLCGAEGYFDQNEALAYEHAERAAITGLAAAEFAMGYFHEVGIHVPVNSTQANLWYTKAAENGNEDAKQRLASGSTITRQDHEQNQNKLKYERNEKDNKDCIIQ